MWMRSCGDERNGTENSQTGTFPSTSPTGSGLCWDHRGGPSIRRAANDGAQQMAESLTYAVAAGQLDGHKMLAFLQQGLGLLGSYGYDKGHTGGFSSSDIPGILKSGASTCESLAKDQTTTWYRLRRYLHLPAWHEPILLMAGLLERPTANDFIDKFEPAKSPFECELHRTCLAQSTCSLIRDFCGYFRTIKHVVERVLSLAGSGSQTDLPID